MYEGWHSLSFIAMAVQDFRSLEDFGSLKAMAVIVLYRERPTQDFRDFSKNLSHFLPWPGISLVTPANRSWRTTMSDTLVCPGCGQKIAVSEMLSAQMESSRRRLDHEYKERLEDELLRRLGQEKTRLVALARAEAQQSQAEQFADLNGQLEAAKKKIKDANQSELQLRRERSELQEEKNELELTVTRTLDTERAAIRERAKMEADEEHRLETAERDLLIDGLRRQIENMKRSCETTKAQTRGEVMERDLEEILREAFPGDEIEPVPASFRGGDILQRVRDDSGHDCGAILWESKRTKNWCDGWLPKLREDQREARAALAILATEALPPKTTHFDQVDGVWVTSRAFMVKLATALRLGMIEAARTCRAHEGRQDKVELLYSYLAGKEFRHRIEGVVEPLAAMQSDLNSEKRSMQRKWNKWEKLIERSLFSTAGMYGDLSGILDSSLPQIECLELNCIPALPEPDHVQEGPGERGASARASAP
jgi:hypothetical protein